MGLHKMLIEMLCCNFLKKKKKKKILKKTFKISKLHVLKSIFLKVVYPREFDLSSLATWWVVPPCAARNMYSLGCTV